MNRECCCCFPIHHVVVVVMIKTKRSGNSRVQTALVGDGELGEFVIPGIWIFEVLLTSSNPQICPQEPQESIQIFNQLVQAKFKHTQCTTWCSSHLISFPKCELTRILSWKNFRAQIYLLHKITIFHSNIKYL